MPPDVHMNMNTYEIFSNTDNNHSTYQGRRRWRTFTDDPGDDWEEEGSCLSRASLSTCHEVPTCHHDRHCILLDWSRLVVLSQLHKHMSNVNTHTAPGGNQITVACTCTCTYKYIQRAYHSCTCTCTCMHMLHRSVCTNS